jgi:transposase InsO family protein
LHFQVDFAQSHAFTIQTILYKLLNKFPPYIIRWENVKDWFLIANGQAQYCARSHHWRSILSWRVATPLHSAAALSHPRVLCKLVHGTTGGQRLFEAHTVFVCLSRSSFTLHWFDRGVADVVETLSSLLKYVLRLGLQIKLSNRVWTRDGTTELPALPPTDGHW